MSLEKAKQAFKENLLKFVSVETSPAAHNVNAGLYHLVDGLELELHNLHSEIARLSQQLAQTATAKR